MKKTFITAAIGFLAFGYALAQQNGTSTDSLPPALPPMMTTGSSTLDAQIKALRQEAESKIKAIRDDYQMKLKAIIGDRRAMIASSTKEMRGEIKEMRQDGRQDIRQMRQDARPEVKGTSTENLPVGIRGFLMKLFQKGGPIKESAGPYTQ